MLRWTKGKRNRHQSGRRGTFFKPFLEVLGDRRLLSSTGLLQGTVINDQTGAPQSGALVQLYQQNNNGNFVPIGQPVTTGSSGSYRFQVTPGSTYQLVETPPSGYVNDSTLIVSSPVESASSINSSTIQVTVPSSVQLTLPGNQFNSSGKNFNGTNNTPGIAAFEILSFSIDGVTAPWTDVFVGQYIASANSGPSFYTFCVDLAPGHQLAGGNNSTVKNVFTVQPEPDLTGMGPNPTTNPNAPEAIAYLYNTFGTGTLSSVNAAALQVAIWTIEFNSTPSSLATDFTSSTDNFHLMPRDPNFISQSTYNAVVSQTQTYLSDAVNAVAPGPLGPSGQAIFLAPISKTSGGEQGVIAPGSLNFSNVPVGSPSITTQQQPASATVGSSIADKAFVAGGNNPTGTVTFKLYNNPNGTGTALFTDTENLVNGVATSAGYTTTATGTDYWVATYNGDSNNGSVTSSPTSEPVTITPTTPQLPPQSNNAVPSVGWLPPWEVSKRMFLSSSDPPPNPALAAAEEALFNAVVQQWVNLWDALLSEAESLLAASYDSGPGNGHVPVF